MVGLKKKKKERKHIVILESNVAITMKYQSLEKVVLI